MPPYIKEIAYKLYALMSELVKKCIIPFCGVLAVIILLLIVLGIMKWKSNKPK